MSILILQTGNISTLEGADMDSIDEWPACVAEQNEGDFIFQITHWGFPDVI